MNRPFVAKLESHLRRRTSILDVGCGDGDISLWLAELGHDVTAITTDETDIAAARERQKQTPSLEGACDFQLVDARDIRQAMRGHKYGAIILSDVLHLMPKGDAAAVIAQAKDATAPNGLHLIRGYVVDPARASAENRAQMLYPGELQRHYAEDDTWRVLEYSEEPFLSAEHDGRQRVQSHANLIARSTGELKL